MLKRGDVRECVKRGEGDPWKRVRVGGLRTKTDKEYQEQASRAIHKKESRDCEERCRLKMEAQRDHSMTGTECT